MSPSKSVNARLLVQVSADIEDKLREFRRGRAEKVQEIVAFLHDLVNSHRMRLFERGPVEIIEVRRAEDDATSDYVDYERRLAEYCTQLVLKE